jgi:hypothetical protein
MSYPSNVFSNGVQYVANYGNDGDDGWSVGTAKASVSAAMADLPNGSSDGSTGTGVVVLEPGYTGTIPSPASPSITIGYPAVTSGVNTISTATATVVRNVIGSITLDYAGSTSVTNVVGVRGVVTIGASTTVAAGYLYGTQGKLIINGTMASGSEVSCGLQGQLDLSNTVALTGPIAAGWLDCGATASAAAITGQAHIDGLVIYNTTAAEIHSIVRVYADASYFMDLTSNGAGAWVVGTAAASGWDKSLKINLNGTPYYIPLNPAAS